MTRHKTLAAALLGGLLLLAPVPFSLAQEEVSAEEKLAALHLEIEKLRQLLAEAKNIQSLEKAGLPREDVMRMRAAIELKVQAMIQNILKQIQEL